MKCGKYNHYTSCCRGGPNPRQGKYQGMYRETVKKTVEAPETSDDSDSEYLQLTKEHTLHQAKKIRSGASQGTVLIRI